jgi:hypothetical protein
MSTAADRYPPSVARLSPKRPVALRTGLTAGVPFVARCIQRGLRIPAHQLLRRADDRSVGICIGRLANARWIWLGAQRKWIAALQRSPGARAVRASKVEVGFQRQRFEECRRLPFSSENHDSGLADGHFCPAFERELEYNFAEPLVDRLGRQPNCRARDAGVLLRSRPYGNSKALEEECDDYPDSLRP